MSAYEPDQAPLGRLGLLEGLRPGDDDPDEVREVRYPAGALIVEVGEVGDASYFILDGQVQVRRGTRVLCRLGVGGCFGELAVLDDVPRAATVEAETPVTVLRVAAARFRRWFEQHPPLVDLLGTMQQAYQRPDGGLVSLHRGRAADGRPAVTSVRALPDGRRLVITRITGCPEMVITASLVDDPSTGRYEMMEYSGEHGERALQLRGGRAEAAHIEGRLDAGVEHLTARIISGRRVSEAEKARFRWTGSTGAVRTQAPLACTCVGLTRAGAEALVAEGATVADLAARCGAGTICGTCAPELEALTRPSPGFLQRLFGRWRR